MFMQDFEFLDKLLQVSLGCVTSLVLQFYQIGFLLEFFISILYRSSGFFRQNYYLKKVHRSDKKTELQVKNKETCLNLTQRSGSRGQNVLSFEQLKY